MCDGVDRIGSLVDVGCLGEEPIQVERQKELQTFWGLSPQTMAKMTAVHYNSQPGDRLWLQMPMVTPQCEQVQAATEV